MSNNKLKIYTCKILIKTSNTTIIKIPVNAIIEGKPKLKWAFKITFKKLTKIFNKIWPATILANKRIAKLKTLEKKEIDLIIIHQKMNIYQVEVIIQVGLMK